MRIAVVSYKKRKVTGLWCCEYGDWGIIGSTIGDVRPHTIEEDAKHSLSSYRRGFKYLVYRKRTEAFVVVL